MPGTHVPRWDFMPIPAFYQQSNICPGINLPEDQYARAYPGCGSDPKYTNFSNPLGFPFSFVNAAGSINKTFLLLDIISGFILSALAYVLARKVAKYDN
jgi:hypothetical protein